MERDCIFAAESIKKKNFKMKKVILRQKKVGVIPRGPYDVYVNNVYVGSVGRYSSLSFTVQEDNFNLRMKYRKFFSSSKDFQISKDNTVVEYEPTGVRLQLAIAVFDVIAIIAMVLHLKIVPCYVWFWGIFGLPVLSIIWELVKRKSFFKMNTICDFDN